MGCQLAAYVYFKIKANDYCFTEKSSTYGNRRGLLEIESQIWRFSLNQSMCDSSRNGRLLHARNGAWQLGLVVVNNEFLTASSRTTSMNYVDHSRSLNCSYAVTEWSIKDLEKHQVEIS